MATTDLNKYDMIRIEIRSPYLTVNILIKYYQNKYENL